MNQKKIESSKRQFLPTFSELIDRLTVDQIKEVLIEGSSHEIAIQIKKIAHDLDLIIKERKIPLNSRLIRIIVILSQMNVHIWYNKDKMKLDPENYDEYLKLAHQLNGLRNQMKNLLLSEMGEEEKSTKKLNFDTDGLEGWEISID